ncbi:MAG: hypothetical protein F6J93_31695 [Oscillatoria sp. SIO1A7]|nr:hypothetical protein [Oscillatoria sp. SIO1A7]
MAGSLEKICRLYKQALSWVVAGLLPVSQKEDCNRDNKINKAISNDIASRCMERLYSATRKSKVKSQKLKVKIQK